MSSNEKAIIEVEEKAANEEYINNQIIDRKIFEKTKIGNISLSESDGEERRLKSEFDNSIINTLDRFFNVKELNEEEKNSLINIIDIIVNEKKLPVTNETYSIITRSIQNREFDTKDRAIIYTPHAKNYMTTASIFSRILNLELDRSEIEEPTKYQLEYTRYLINKFYNFIHCDKKTNVDVFTSNFKSSIYGDIINDDKIELLHKFLKEEEKGKCYICNKTIKSQMEIEHVLPFAFAAQYGGIGVKNYWQIVKKDTKINNNGNLVFDFGDKPYKKAQYSYKTADKQKYDKKFIINNNQVYLNKYELLFSLLEVRESHKCCNQIKSACVFIKRDGNGEYAPYIDGLTEYVNDVQQSKLYDCEHIEIDKGDIEKININLEKYFGLVANILNKMENKITEDFLTLDDQSSQTQLNNNEKERLKQFYDIVRIASFEYIIPPHIAEKIGKVETIENMHVIQAEKFILQAISKYSLKSDTYNNAEDYNSFSIISNKINEFFKKSINEEEINKQWNRIYKSTGRAGGRIRDTVKAIINGTLMFNFEKEEKEKVDKLNNLYNYYYPTTQKTNNIFLVLVSLIYARYVSNNIIFPADYEYIDFEKKIKKNNRSVKENLINISINLFIYILLGFKMYDGDIESYQYEEIFFYSPYNCEKMTQDKFEKVFNDLLESSEEYSVAETLSEMTNTETTDELDDITQQVNDLRIRLNEVTEEREKLIEENKELIQKTSKGGNRLTMRFRKNKNRTRKH